MELGYQDMEELIKMFTLSLTEQEMMILSEALGELPFKRAAALIGKLQQQVNEQLSAQKKED
jgi:hypothetical protein